MSTSPKFRITIQGIATGMRADRVYLALGKKFALSPAEVELLLANKAGPLVGLMEHEAAWTLRNELRQLGVDCHIAPVPRSHLADAAPRMSLQVADPHRRSGQPPRPRPVSHPIRGVRRGQTVHARRRPARARAPLSLPPLIRVAVVLAVAVAAGITLQNSRESPGDAFVVADSAR